MQTLFQKVSKKVGNMVGSHDAGKLGDEILQDCKQRLDELEQQVTNVRSQFATYAEQMMQSCEASVLLSKSVADFYRSANNTARSESVKVYEEVQDNAANNAVAIYQRQLQMDDGVISELDQWLQIVARVNEQIEEADRLRQAAETAAARLQTLQGKVDSRTIFGQNDGTDLQNRIEETERAQKNFEADFESARDEVRENVGRIMQKRFTMFDRVYVQILECQVHFFERASTDIDKFRRSIRNYRRKFPRNSGDMTSALSHGISRATSETRGSGSRSGDHSPPKERPVSHYESAPIESSKPGSLQRAHTNFLAEFGTDDGGIASSGAGQDESGEFFGENQYTEVPASNNNNNTNDPPPQPKRQQSYMIGIDLEYFDNPPARHSDGELDRPPRAAPLNENNRRHSRSSVDLKNAGAHRTTASSMFNDDFWASPSSQPAAPARDSMDPLDPMDPMSTLMGTDPTPTEPIRVAPSQPDEKQSEPPHLMEERPQHAGGRGAGVLNMNDAAGRRAFVRQLQEDEKRNHENREQAQDAVEARLREWEFKGDVRRNLRSLLTSMDRVLWEGAKWKTVQMTDLLSHEKISKKYKKGLNSVHPDKISLVRGFNPEQIAIAEGVFMALNEAWIEYERTQN